MKVYILFRDIDYEGSNIIRVCETKEDADSRLVWLRENQRMLRESIGEGNALEKTWEAEYQGFPGESYHLEEWDVRAEKP